MATKPPKKPPLAPLGTRVKTDPALLARALRDPGLRSKLPDQYLSAPQLAARQRRNYLGDLGDIGSPLSGQSMVNAARETVDSDYAPLLADVGNKENIVNKSAGIQGDWAKRYYGNLDSLLGSIGTAQAAANHNAVAGATDIGNTAHIAVAGADQTARQQLAADAAVRGADVQGDAVANQALRTQTAQNAVANNSDAAQTTAQNYGDVQSAFLRGLQGAAAQQGGEYQQAITGQQGQLLNQLGETRKDLALKKAGAFTDTLLKLRSGEQTSAITQAGLGIKQDAAGAAADASAGAEGRKYGYTPSEWLGLPASARTGIVAAANKKTPSASDRKTKADLAYFKIHGYYPPTGPPKAGKGAGAGKGKPATNAEVGQAQTGVGGAQAAARAAGIPVDQAHRKQLQDLITAGSPESSATINQKTSDGSVSTKVVKRPAIDKHDPLYTSVALDILIDGHVSRYNAKRLKGRHLTVKDLGLESYTDWKKKGAGNRQVQGSETMATNGPGRS